MKATGIVRKMDTLGRIVLPVELRRKLDIQVKDEVEIFVDGEQIILQKYAPHCVFCGESENLLHYNEKNVCPACAKNLVSMAK